MRFACGLAVAALMGAALAYLTAHVYPMITPVSGMANYFARMDSGRGLRLFSELVLPACALGVSVRYYFLLTDEHEIRYVLLLLLGYWTAVFGVFLLLSLIIERLIVTHVIEPNRYGEIGTFILSWWLPLLAAGGTAYLGKILFVARSVDSDRNW